MEIDLLFTGVSGKEIQEYSWTAVFHISITLGYDWPF